MVSLRFRRSLHTPLCRGHTSPAGKRAQWDQQSFRSLDATLFKSPAAALTAEATVYKCARPFVGCRDELREGHFNNNSSTDRLGVCAALRRNQDPWRSSTVS